MTIIQVETLVHPHVIAQMIQFAHHTPTGCFVEVGVYKGGTALSLLQKAKEQSRELFAYDTFEGLPYKGELDDLEVGRFSDTSYDTVNALLDGATVVKGIFPGSAVTMPGVAFAHIDCDQYQAVKESIEYLKPMMVDNSVMWFDDALVLDGATKAVMESFPMDKIYLAECGKLFTVISKEVT